MPMKLFSLKYEHFQCLIFLIWESLKYSFFFYFFSLVTFTQFLHVAVSLVLMVKAHIFYQYNLQNLLSLFYFHESSYLLYVFSFYKMQKKEKWEVLKILVGSFSSNFSEINKMTLYQYWFFIENILMLVKSFC